MGSAARARWRSAPTGRASTSPRKKAAPWRASTGRPNACVGISSGAQRFHFALTGRTGRLLARRARANANEPDRLLRATSNQRLGGGGPVFSHASGPARAAPRPLSLRSIAKATRHRALQAPAPQPHSLGHAEIGGPMPLAPWPGYITRENGQPVPPPFRGSGCRGVPFSRPLTPNTPFLAPNGGPDGGCSV